MCFPNFFTKPLSWFEQQLFTLGIPNLRMSKTKIYKVFLSDLIDSNI